MTVVAGVPVPCMVSCTQWGAATLYLLYSVWTGLRTGQFSYSCTDTHALFLSLHRSLSLSLNLTFPVVGVDLLLLRSSPAGESRGGDEEGQQGGEEAVVGHGEHEAHQEGCGGAADKHTVDKPSHWTAPQPHRHLNHSGHDSSDGKQWFCRPFNWHHFFLNLDMELLWLCIKVKWEKLWNKIKTHIFSRHAVRLRIFKENKLTIKIWHWF